MNITSKSRYALKIMMDLAAHPVGLTHRSEIATRQGIPLDYMDQILIRLKDHQLIESTRGRAGGYRLGKPPQLISTFDIFRAVEDGFAPVQCLDGGVGCFAEDFCQSKDAWTTISSAITHALSGIILSDLVGGRPVGGRSVAGRPLGGRSLDASLALVPQDPQECRAPRRTHNTLGLKVTKDLGQKKS